MKEFDLRLTEILERISYKQFNFHVISEGDRRFLQLRWQAICATTGTPYFNKSRKWFLSEFMTTSEIVQTVFKAILTAEEHEIREHFKYRNESVFGPHFDIEKIVDMIKAGNCLDIRD